jgi:Eukaryotic elongation factor 5A hypusine, DNA-binding OB fold
VTILTASGDTRSDLKLPDVMNPAPPGASELSGKIRTLLKEEKEFFLIVQSACGIEQIMDIKVMTQ